VDVVETGCPSCQKNIEFPSHFSYINCPYCGVLLEVLKISGAITLKVMEGNMPTPVIIESYKGVFDLKLTHKAEKSYLTKDFEEKKGRKDKTEDGKKVNLIEKDDFQERRKRVLKSLDKLDAEFIKRELKERVKEEAVEEIKNKEPDEVREKEETQEITFAEEEKTEEIIFPKEEKTEEIIFPKEEKTEEIIFPKEEKTEEPEVTEKTASLEDKFPGTQKSISEQRNLTKLIIPFFIIIVLAGIFVLLYNPIKNRINIDPSNSPTPDLQIGRAHV